MKNRIEQALIAGGGKGTRVGRFVEKYGNKSLIEIKGKPIIYYTVEWLREAGIKRIIITVNYKTEYRKIADFFKEYPDVTVIYGKPMYPSLERFDPYFVFIYGHAPAPAKHIKKLIAVSRSKFVAASVYKKSTQPPRIVKRARMKNNHVIIDGEGDLCIEPPYLLNHELTTLFQETGSGRKSFEMYAKPVLGVKANFPPEFNYLHDFEVYRNFLTPEIKREK